MPALITHYTFGGDIYERRIDAIGGTQDAHDAFLLGNQGPDVFFYALANPRIAPAFRFARMLHRLSPAPIIAAFDEAARELPAADQPIARAYTLGFLCHYLADSTIHPFVYAQQYALCDAGEPGLTRDDGSEVHGLIETELDEMVLFLRTGQTIATFRPAREILRASVRTLEVLDELYARAAPRLTPSPLPSRLFSAAFASWQRIQHLLWSPSGTRRALLGRAESLLRHYSYLQSLSHRPVARVESDFDNRARELWTDPFSGLTRTESFLDLYAQARHRALAAVNAYAADSAQFLADLPGLTQGRNFLGDFVEPAILTVEDGAVDFAEKTGDAAVKTDGAIGDEIVDECADETVDENTGETVDGEMFVNEMFVDEMFVDEMFVDTAESEFEPSASAAASPASSATPSSSPAP